MVIMLLVFGFLPKQAQPCNRCGPQTVEWITKFNEVHERDKQEKMSRVDKANKAEAEGLSHIQKKKDINQEL